MHLRKASRWAKNSGVNVHLDKVNVAFHADALHKVFQELAGKFSERAGIPAGKNLDFPLKRKLVFQERKPLCLPVNEQVDVAAGVPV